MRRTMLVVLGIVSVVLLRATASEPANDQDKSKLIGTWNVTAEEKDGRHQTADAINGKTVKITANTISCMGKDGKADMSARYELDTSASPWRIELNCTEGEHKGKTVKGIVKLEGDTLRICHAAKPDANAPTEFTTKENQCSFTLKRAVR
jgi:uncharacterized protein (TIGR03067 family)